MRNDLARSPKNYNAAMRFALPQRPKEIRWALITLLLATLACGPMVSVQVTAVAIGPGTPLPNISLPLSGVLGTATPAPPAPEIFLEHSGTQFAPNQTQNILKLKTGESVEIIIRAPTLPAVLWISELDANGLPLATATLTPTAANTAYTPQSTGPLRLKIIADWAYPDSVTSVFDLEITE